MIVEGRVRNWGLHQTHRWVVVCIASHVDGTHQWVRMTPAALERLMRFGQSAGHEFAPGSVGVPDELAARTFRFHLDDARCVIAYEEIPS